MRSSIGRREDPPLGEQVTHVLCSLPLLVHATNAQIFKSRLDIQAREGGEEATAQDAWADDMVLAEGLHRFEQAVTVPVTRVLHSWAGLRTFAPDRVFVAGFDPRAEGFFWLAGQGGYGVQSSPAMAALTRYLVTGAALGGDFAGLERHVAEIAPQRLLPATPE